MRLSPSGGQATQTCLTESKLAATLRDAGSKCGLPCSTLLLQFCCKAGDSTVFKKESEVASDQNLALGAEMNKTPCDSVKSLESALGLALKVPPFPGLWDFFKSQKY